MDRKSSAGIFKTFHLAVDCRHGERPHHGRSAVEWLLERANQQSAVNICGEFERRTASWTERVNRARALSGNGEKAGGKERKRAHEDERVDSPNYGGENGIVRKWLALLWIVREEGLNALMAVASSNGD